MKVKQKKSQRASREEILNRLRTLFDDNTVTLVSQAADLAATGKNGNALSIIKSLDVSLGGIGLHDFQEKRKLGVYRPLFYVYLPLRSSSEPQQFSRSIAYHAGAYLEELLKHLVRIGFLEQLRFGYPSLGTLVISAQKKLPNALFVDLDWLAQGIHNFAKHKNSFDNEMRKEAPEHYFELDEAIAIYFIARKLGLELEKLIGKTSEQLMKE